MHVSSESSSVAPSDSSDSAGSATGSTAGSTSGNSADNSHGSATGNASDRSWAERLLRVSGWYRWLLPLLLVVLGAVVYAPAAWGVFVLDDRRHIMESTKLASLLPLDQFLHRRGLMDFTLALNYAIDGLNPRGYHILNVVIHLLASLALFGVIRRLLQLPQWSTKLRDKAWELAFIIAAIWMVHPLQTQAVTYVIQRGESMAGLFVLLAAYGLVRLHAVSTPSVSESDSNSYAPSGLRGKLAWGSLCVAAMVCAIWTKEIAVTGPACLILLDRCLLADSFKAMLKRRWWLHGLLVASMALPMFSGLGELTVREVQPITVSQDVNEAASPAETAEPETAVETKAPVATVAPVAPVVARPAALHTLPASMMLDHYPSAGFGMPGMTWQQYFFTQPAVICYYLKASFWPSWLSIEHNWRPMMTPWAGRRAIDLQLAFALLVILAVGTLWALWRLPWLGLAGSWFFLSLSVSSSFIPINDVAVEHRMYLALISVVSVVVLGGWQLVLTIARKRTGVSAFTVGWACTLVAMVCMVVAALGTRSFVRNLDYQSELALWEGAIRGQVPNVRLHLNYGSALYEADRKGEAKLQYEKALELRPGDSNALLNLGSMYFNQRDLNTAERYYRQTLRMSPRSATACVYLSRIERRRGNDVQALIWLEKANDNEPGNLDILNSLAKVQFNLKQYEQAGKTYQQILDMQGPTTAGLTNLGMVRVSQGQLEKASAIFTQATQVDPTFIHSWEQLARNEARQKRFKNALDALNHAIAIDPAMRLKQQMAMLLAHAPDREVRNVPQAMEIVKQALQLTQRQDPAWLEVAAKVALAADRPDLALQAEMDALAIVRQRGASPAMIQNGEAEITRLRKMVNKMQYQGS